GRAGERRRQLVEHPADDVQALRGGVVEPQLGHPQPGVGRGDRLEDLGDAEPATPDDGELHLAPAPPARTTSRQMVSNTGPTVRDRAGTAVRCTGPSFTRIRRDRGPGRSEVTEHDDGRRGVHTTPPAGPPDPLDV